VGADSTVEPGLRQPLSPDPLAKGKRQMANAVAAWLTAACLSICRSVCKHAKMFCSIVPIPMNLSPPPWKNTSHHPVACELWPDYWSWVSLLGAFLPGIFRSQARVD